MNDIESIRKMRPLPAAPIGRCAGVAGAALSAVESVGEDLGERAKHPVYKANTNQRDTETQRTQTSRFGSLCLCGRCFGVQDDFFGFAGGGGFVLAGGTMPFMRA